MTITTALAYLLIVAYFVVERVLRKGEQAQSLQPGLCDRGSSYLLLSVGLLNLLILGLAPLGNSYDIGFWDNNYVGWIGVLLMLVGLMIRYLAARTLGTFYTRTLRVLEAHQIIEQGLYRIIRHPGYFGLSAMEIGAGLAVNNWMALSFVSLTGLASRLYRIRTEEEMLKNRFGEQYKIYTEKTWRLIPFIY